MRGALSIWRRHFLVWRKIALASLVGNFLDPLMYLLALGWGLGGLLPPISGMPYLTFLAGGMICYGAVNAATFEGLYSTFTRMAVQRTWEGMLMAPLGLFDILLGELLWCAAKSLLNGYAMVLVVAALGLCRDWTLLAFLPLIFVVGLAFGALAIAMSAFSRTYDMFMYYFTLFITPMTFLCGVFFPTERLPPVLRDLATILPLHHAVAVSRGLVAGKIIPGWEGHVLVLLAYAVLGFALAYTLAKKRFLS